MTCVLPPLTYKTTGFDAPVANLPISMWPTQWLTPTNGTFHNSDSVRAQMAQDCRGPPIPGPLVKQTKERQNEKVKNEVLWDALHCNRPNPIIIARYTLHSQEIGMICFGDGLLTSRYQCFWVFLSRKCFREGRTNQCHDVVLVMRRGLFGKKSLSRWCYVGLAWVR